jgi:DNA-binding NtrC family response regulator
MTVLLLASNPDTAHLELLRGALPGATIDPVSSVFDACQRLRQSAYQLIAAFLPIPDWPAGELLDELQRLNGMVPAVLFDPHGSTDAAVEATKSGAFYYFGPDPPADRVRKVLEAAIEQRRSRELALFGHSLVHEPWRKYLVGESEPMNQLAQVIRLVGPRRCTVLITGETGTGKEMAARALHMASLRAHLPLVAINCHALPESLLEAELFGHVKGAFTGAANHRIGRFEQAHRSTLFLDEIGDMPVNLQAKLLRVLQEREFQRIGSSETVQVDVRVIAATNVDLLERVRAGGFREDLYYRLNVVPMRLPPLRERVGDVPLLAHHFLDKIARQEDMRVKEITPEALDRLRRQSWPGNVRQLENAVEMAIALSGDRMTLYPSDFPLEPPSARKPMPAAANASVAVPDDGLDFEHTVSTLERSLLEQALRKTHGNKKLAAELLRLKRTTLTAKLKTLELSEATA